MVDVARCQNAVDECLAAFAEIVENSDMTETEAYSTTATMVTMVSHGLISFECQVRGTPFKTAKRKFLKVLSEMLDDQRPTTH